MSAVLPLVAAVLTLSSPAGRMSVDRTTGAVLSVTDADGRDVGWRSGAGGVFRLAFDGGLALNAADFASNGVLRVEGGTRELTVSAVRPEAEVNVVIVPTDVGFDFRGEVMPKSGIVTSLEVPGDLVFDPNGVSRVYFPQIGNEGPGFALHRGFFLRGDDAASFGWGAVSTGGRATRGVFRSNAARNLDLRMDPIPVRVTDEGRRMLDEKTVRFLENSRFAVNRPTAQESADCVLAESDNGPFLCGSRLGGRGAVWRIGECPIKRGQAPDGAHPRLAAALCRMALGTALGKVGFISLTRGPLRGTMTGAPVTDFEETIRPVAAAFGRELVLLRTPAEVSAARRGGFAVIVNPYGESFPCEGEDASSLDRFAAELRAYVAKGGHWIECGGLSFFRALVPARYLSYGGQYPKVFSDWFAVKTAEGVECASYAVRPRPPHEPWKAKEEFVAGWLGCGGSAEGGRLTRRFDCFAEAGSRWRAPTVRFRFGPMGDTLDAYARDNDLTRPLADKIPAAKLQAFKEAPLLKWQSRASELMDVLKDLPVPTLVHVSKYLKGGFDKEYPDHLPSNEERFGTDAEHRAMIDALHRAGHLYSPYTNPTWWCDEPRGPTFLQEGEGALKLGRNGEKGKETYGAGVTGWTITFWHPAVRAANRRTVRQFTQELPVDLLFQDQCGARRWSPDFNPASPTPTAYIEGLLSMVEEDSRDVPLATEDGWDRVADSEAALCGIAWSTVPLKLKGGHALNKETLPPDLWEYELIAQRVMHDKTLFFMHDLGAFVTDRRVLAWMFALGYQLSYCTDVRHWTSNAEIRAWYAGLSLLQRHVFSRIAGKRVTYFRHDRAPMLSRKGYDRRGGADDGVVGVKFEDVTVAVNLGDVPRTVGGKRLAPYGWFVSAPGLESSALEGEPPVIAVDGRPRQTLFGNSGQESVDERKAQ